MEPVVSVVVPAHNAAATIGRTLEALAAQDMAAEHEVIVVDDHSTDATGSMARAAGARVVRPPEHGGPAGARNAGIEAARAPLLAFTDADCAPTPGWLGALVGALADADLVTGPVLPDPDVPARRFDRTLRLTGPSPRFETANLAVRRDVAERVGGFRPVLPPPDHFGEDVLFGWSARRSGARVAFVPGALVHHAVFRRGPRGYIAERERLALFPALVREVPELRASMPNRVFLSARTRRFDAAVVGLTLALLRRRAWPLALCLPYVRRDLRTWSAFSRGGLSENAALVAADTVGLLALLRGGLATRRPLL